MKVLLDENFPHRLRKSLGLHAAFTVRYMGWMGLKNGELIRMAEDAGFQVLITGDQTLHLEQNLAGRRLSIVVLSSIDWRFLKDNLTRIIAAIDNSVAGSLEVLESGTFTRKKPPTA